MPVIVLTNNPLLDEKKLDGISVIRFGQHDEIINACGEMIKDGWLFSADPAAGYSKHYNPYHTVFMEKWEPAQEETMKHQQRLMRVLVEKLSNLARKPVEKSEQIRKDYMYLDSELALSTLRMLKETTAWQGWFD